LTQHHLEEIWDRERGFHDRLAEELDPTNLPEPALSALDAAMFDLLGDVAGTSVLDAGCGQGDLTVLLARRGAHVAALDLSPGMVDVARRRAALQLPAGRMPQFHVAPLERTGLGDASVDTVIGRFILHHIDVALGAAELRRVLKPGGRAFFAENSGANPILGVARDHLAGRFGIPRYGTEDEHPLKRHDIEAMQQHFREVRLHHPVFDFFKLLDRQVFKYRRPRVSRACNFLDDRLQDIPAARPWSYRVVVELRV
jgi:ubiquinone/menaquinone biosynthesis C-methylase UbiE